MVWEQRWHPLREEWVIVAAHRQDRPWTCDNVTHSPLETPDYQADCPLCPGNRRVSGKETPVYQDVYVFDNDHPCVGPDAPHVLPSPIGIYRNQPAKGLARVVCYSPLHNVTLAEMTVNEIDHLLEVWQAQYQILGDRDEVNHVLIFENKGQVVGMSNPHPHCQIYATTFVFHTIEREVRISHCHKVETGRVLFQDIIKAERMDGRRLIDENDTAIAFLPYFARYAYEVFVAPKGTYPSLTALSNSERRDFSALLKQVLVRLDNLWQIPFPYVMVLHQAPTATKECDGFHFHVEFHPPLRKPNLLKYLAGPEIGGGNFLSDTAPEEMAEQLRSLSEVHYKLTCLSN